MQLRKLSETVLKSSVGQKKHAAQLLLLLCPFLKHHLESLARWHPPPIPAGEDKVSFQRHANALCLEFKKVKPNMSVVDDLMTMSFAMRWEDLHNNSYDIGSVFQKYPFLRMADKVNSCVCVCVMMEPSS